jgi:hypothetical protein
MPGVALALKPDVIMNKAGNSYTASGTAMVAAPALPLPTVAALSAAAAVGPCDALTLDASASSGGGGRAMTYSFAVTAAAADASSVSVAIADAAAAGPVIVLGADALTPGVTYTFSVRVTDYAGGTSVSSAVVTKGQYPKPIAQVLGGSARAARRSEAVNLEADATLPDAGCAAAAGAFVGAGITFQW